VFALVTDPPRKGALNPNVQVIRIEVEGGGPVREGSIIYHRLQKGQRLFEYRSRCLRMIPSMLFESRAETEPPFEVKVVVEPTPEGCLLTQQESLEVTPALLDSLEPVPGGAGPLQEAMGLLALLPGLRSLGSEVRRRQRESLTRRLTAELTAWLGAIRAHFEAGEVGSGTPGPERYENLHAPRGASGA
jgi:hypothetical protein